MNVHEVKFMRILKHTDYESEEYQVPDEEFARLVSNIALADERKDFYAVMEVESYEGNETFEKELSTRAWDADGIKEAVEALLSLYMFECGSEDCCTVVAAEAHGNGTVLTLNTDVLSDVGVNICKLKERLKLEAKERKILAGLKKKYES